jgi:glycine C-acetyltransferase
VPKRLARLRLSLMATHTRADLDQTLEALERVGRKYGII